MQVSSEIQGPVGRQAPKLCGPSLNFTGPQWFSSESVVFFVFFFNCISFDLYINRKRNITKPSQSFKVSVITYGKEGLQKLILVSLILFSPPPLQDRVKLFTRPF